MTTDGQTDTHLEGDGAPWAERYWVWIAGAIVVASTVVCLSLVTSVWYAHTDAVKYMDSARALSRGDGYLFNGGPEAKHAPGFAMMLVPLFWIQADPFLLARVMIVLTAGAALYVAGVVLRRGVGPWVSLAAVACAGFSASLCISTQSVFSEYPFALLQNVGLLLMLSVIASSPVRLRSAVAFGLVAAAAFLTRSAAAALLATCVYVLVRRRFAGKLTTASTITLGVSMLGLPVLASVAWRLYTAIYVGSAVPENLSILLRRGYATDPGSAYIMMAVDTTKNLLADGGGLFFSSVQPALHPSIEPLIWVALALAWLPFAVAIVVRGLWRAEPLWTFLGAYIGMIIMWPLAMGATARLCWPIAPFIAAGLLWSYRWLGAKLWPSGGAKLATVLVLGAMLAGQLRNVWTVWPGVAREEKFWTERLADLEEIRDRFHPAPPAVWAHLNMRASVYVFDVPTTVMEFTWPKNPEKWAADIAEYRPDYIVVPDVPTQRENAALFVETLLREHPTAHTVAELDTLKLYHIPRISPSTID